MQSIPRIVSALARWSAETTSVPGDEGVPAVVRACKVWREAEPEASRLLEAALAWELATGRKATAGDEGVVRDRRRRMDEATAAAKVEE